MTRAYYSEIDPFAAQWLRNLIKAKLIMAGEVDERSIAEVQPDDLRDFTRCHFFAGIAGWDLALQLAGWPADRPVWTGSCPCQPFSVIGKRRGFKDERDLWPTWFSLIKQRRPPVVFGEQVDRASIWLDRTHADLEAAGYACGTANLPAACVGARHNRQRLWFVADADEARWADVEGLATAEAQVHQQRSARVVLGQAIEHLHWSAQPDSSWIVDGLSGEGFAVGAFGNAIVPQVAAEFIAAYLECRP